MADDTSTTATPETGATPEHPDTPTTDVEKLKRALDQERAGRRDAEKARKAAEADNEKFRTASLTETERAIAEAKAAGRSEALTEAGKRLATAEFRAAAAAASLDVGAVLDLVDVTRFLGDDGEPDTEAIAEAVSKLTALRGEQQPPPPAGLDLGPRQPVMALNGDPIVNALKSKLHIH